MAHLSRTLRRALALAVLTAAAVPTLAHATVTESTVTSPAKPTYRLIEPEPTLAAETLTVVGHDRRRGQGQGRRHLHLRRRLRAGRRGSARSSPAARSTPRSRSPTSRSISATCASSRRAMPRPGLLAVHRPRRRREQVRSRPATSAPVRGTKRTAILDYVVETGHQRGAAGIVSAGGGGLSAAIGVKAGAHEPFGYPTWRDGAAIVDLEVDGRVAYTAADIPLFQFGTEQSMTPAGFEGLQATPRARPGDRRDDDQRVAADLPLRGRRRRPPDGGGMPLGPRHRHPPRADHQPDPRALDRRRPRPLGQQRRPRAPGSGAVHRRRRACEGGRAAVAVPRRPGVQVLRRGRRDCRRGRGPCWSATPPTFALPAPSASRRRPSGSPSTTAGRSPRRRSWPCRPAARLRCGASSRSAATSARRRRWDGRPRTASRRRASRSRACRGAATATVRGRATDNVGVVALSVNGRAAAVAADGSFSVPVALLRGANEISVTATDGAGLSANARVVAQGGAVRGCRVPRVKAGARVKAARAAIRKAGCKARTRRVSSRTVRKGRVVGLSRKAGTRGPARHRGPHPRERRQAPLRVKARGYRELSHAGGGRSVARMLIERATEISTLERSLASVSEGTGAAVVIEAPAGAGKSALLDLVETRAREAGWLVRRAAHGPADRRFRSAPSARCWSRCSARPRRATCSGRAPRWRPSPCWSTTPSGPTARRSRRSPTSRAAPRPARC